MENISRYNKIVNTLSKYDVSISDIAFLSKCSNSFNSRYNRIISAVNRSGLLIDDIFFVINSINSSSNSNSGKNNSNIRNTKYFMEDGTKLITYCTDNELPYNTIISRIKKYNITADEAVKHSSDHPSTKFKYFMEDGTKLVSYCRDNNISYAVATKKIREYNLSPDEAVKDNLHVKTKYFMEDGTSLSKYCKINNICYVSVIDKMKRFGLSTDKAVKIVGKKPSYDDDNTNRYDSINKYFMKDGTHLRRYCIKNDMSYIKVFNTMKQYGLSPDEAVIEYDNMNLYKYCKLSKIDYQKVMHCIEIEKMSIEDAVLTAKLLKADFLPELVEHLVKNKESIKKVV
jgi:hypothetical protein